jgi:ubiquinone/menaquinone biosynthesis C-methylase UbiE
LSFYDRRVLPRLIDRGMRNKVMTKYRPRIPRLATGRVLEIGTGAGLNFPFYGIGVSQLFALEPSDVLRDAAAMAAVTLPFPVTIIGSGAEDIPLASRSIDTIVSTWTLCSIPGIEAALVEMRRVLKPAGRLLFMEHGLAPEPDVVRSQKRWAPVLRAVAGCNPDRPVDRLIGEAGFAFGEIERCYLDGPRFIAYHYVGEARPA